MTTLQQQVTFYIHDTDNVDELRPLFSQAFSTSGLDISDVNRLGKEKLQQIDDWFALNELPRYK